MLALHSSSFQRTTPFPSESFPPAIYTIPLPLDTTGMNPPPQLALRAALLLLLLLSSSSTLPQALSVRSTKTPPSVSSTTASTTVASARRRSSESAGGMPSSLRFAGSQSALRGSWSPALASKTPNVNFSLFSLPACLSSPILSKKSESAQPPSTPPPPTPLLGLATTPPLLVLPLAPWKPLSEKLSPSPAEGNAVQVRREPALPSQLSSSSSSSSS
mmetsp:Transcript_58442/g.114839  ORF Transcript_58442/g.114839 Transcript_58442/m.114839 type:complete len:217 (-) Transcript_58442:976-1626(-)